MLWRRKIKTIISTSNLHKYLKQDDTVKDPFKFSLIIKLSECAIKKKVPEN